MARTARKSTKAVGYIRVSTEKQADCGISLEAQQTKLEADAQLYDLERVEVIIDRWRVCQDARAARPSACTAHTAQDQATALLVVKLNRLTRSVKDLGTLVEEYFSSDRITLLSVADAIDTRTAAGRLVLNVLGSVASGSEMIGERTAQAQADKRE